jgi:myo-inositol-1(or 4)-monophosphatase
MNDNDIGEIDIDINKIIEAGKAGGDVLQRYFGTELKKEKKSSPSNFRTIADLEAEDAILDILQANFPSVNIHSEERGFLSKRSQYTFIVDPLDGTSNFVSGIRYFSVSIGLFKEDKSLAGVVINPLSNEVFFAESGKGAFLNGDKIKVNEVSDLEEASIGYDCDYGYYFNEYHLELAEQMKKHKVKRFFIFMSPALDFCRLALGQIEAFINNGNEVYDFAAGKLIVKEAGGLVTAFDGSEEKNERNNIFLATNGSSLHQKLLNIIR